MHCKDTPEISVRVIKRIEFIFLSIHKIFALPVSAAVVLAWDGYKPLDLHSCHEAVPAPSQDYLGAAPQSWSGAECVVRWGYSESEPAGILRHMQRSVEESSLV